MGDAPDLAKQVLHPGSLCKWNLFFAASLFCSLVLRFVFAVRCIAYLQHWTEFYRGLVADCHSHYFVRACAAIAIGLARDSVIGY